MSQEEVNKKKCDYCKGSVIVVMMYISILAIRDHYILETEGVFSIGLLIGFIGGVFTLMMGLKNPAFRKKFLKELLK